MSLVMGMGDTGTRDTGTRFWDRNAQRYARSVIKDMAGYERTLARTTDLIAGTNVVLEIGCGTGTTALRLAPHVRRIVATDVSQEMISIARGKAADAMVGNVTFAVAEADASLPLDEPLDAVLAFNLLHLVDDRRTLLQRAIKRLKPGGLFISKTPCLLEMNPFIRLAVPPMRIIGLAPPVSFFRSLDLEREIARAGFAIEEIARHGSGPKDARVFLVAQKPGGQ
jgi:SAM-dependent methyltransferase